MPSTITTDIKQKSFGRRMTAVYKGSKNLKDNVSILSEPGGFRGRAATSMNHIGNDDSKTEGDSISDGEQSRIVSNDLSMSNLGKSPPKSRFAT